MKGVIRLGDLTNHGGKVISASTKITVFDKGVARVGDMVLCPIIGHGVNPIIEGDVQFTDEGRHIAFHGHKTACGCALISSLSHFGRKS
ncbi:PAAR domain-containing protein [Candidatus Schmidhempelia bombi]|uniref:PAAR domain-containing protein n=1 Tax=Candidatus Schmidhempelia bombi str. Bimp TaxID=1387197 RepID=A0AB94IA55_9GAMM|nr:PAAR domain-containing protein [Candidatus Schmidhempelia bombi]TEA26262.1 PAAR domain-containing protein [Candidatus Schmidhempelia bombi str. Bimp]